MSCVINAHQAQKIKQVSRASLHTVPATSLVCTEAQGSPISGRNSYKDIVLVPIF